MSPATLSDRLRALFPDSSGRSLKQWLESGRVEVNGRLCRDGRAVVGPKDRVVLGTRGRVPGARPEATLARPLRARPLGLRAKPAPML